MTISTKMCHILTAQMHQPRQAVLQMLSVHLNAESNAKMSKRCYHDHKTWTSYNWKRTRDSLLGRLSHHSLHQVYFTFGEHTSLDSGVPGTKSKTRRKFSDSVSNVVVCL
jgi:hypothetical protein